MINAFQQCNEITVINKKELSIDLQAIVIEMLSYPLNLFYISDYHVQVKWFYFIIISAIQNMFTTLWNIMS